jgi:hypothetical protein
MFCVKKFYKFYFFSNCILIPADVDGLTRLWLEPQELGHLLVLHVGCLKVLSLAFQTEKKIFEIEKIIKMYHSRNGGLHIF